jgi:glucose-1-phosphate thymidylyltransferase
MKGLILAGGNGTRLQPLTLGMSKQLLPIFDKPMIYHPLSTLMLANIRDIQIIIKEEHLGIYKKLFQDGSHLGLNISYAIQNEPRGLAEAFIICKDFIGNDSSCLVLGDNIFFGHDLQDNLIQSSKLEEGAIIYAYAVNDPSQFGVVEFDENFSAISIEEKPENPRSIYAVTGIYFYDNLVVDFARDVKPSERGELEITSINQAYLNQKRLNVQLLGRGMTWLDAGTHESLLEASHFVSTIERRQGMKIACLEEIAWRKGWISDEDLEAISLKMGDSFYSSYLSKLLLQK